MNAADAENIAIDCCKSAAGLQLLKTDMKENLVDLLNNNELHSLNVDVLPMIFFVITKKFLCSRG